MYKNARNRHSESEKLAWQLISNAWDNKKLASVYLFFGPDGTGRQALAVNLAKAVNCEKDVFPACLVCSSCRKIENGNHPDVHVIKKQDSNFIKIEQIQKMHKEISLRPFEGKRKVFIIQNAEDFSPEAANSLLKILEEPGNDSLIVLIVSDLRLIFPTIISRCQKIRFFPLSREEAEEVFVSGYHIDAAVSHYLAYAFEGRVREALKFKDTDIFKVKNDIIRTAINSPDLLFNNYEAKDREKLIEGMKILVSCFRDIYLLKTGVDKTQLINRDIEKELIPVLHRWSLSDLNSLFQQLCDLLDNVRQNINPRLLMDNIRLLLKS